MEKVFKVGQGEITVQEFDMESDNFDARAAFERMLACFDGYSQSDLRITLESLSGFRQSFLSAYDSEEKFLSLSKKEKYMSLSALSHKLISLVKNDEYLVGAGCSLFQVWLVCLIKGDDTVREYIETKISEIRTTKGI